MYSCCHYENTTVNVANVVFSIVYLKLIFLLTYSVYTLLIVVTALKKLGNQV